MCYDIVVRRREKEKGESMTMLNEHEVNRLNTLFGGRTEDVNAVLELCENDEVLNDYMNGSYTCGACISFSKRG